MSAAVALGEAALREAAEASNAIHESHDRLAFEVGYLRQSLRTAYAERDDMGALIAAQPNTHEALKTIVNACEAFVEAAEASGAWVDLDVVAGHLQEAAGAMRKVRVYTAEEREEDACDNAEDWRREARGDDARQAA